MSNSSKSIMVSKHFNRDQSLQIYKIDQKIDSILHKSDMKKSKARKTNIDQFIRLVPKDTELLMQSLQKEEDLDSDQEDSKSLLHPGVISRLNELEIQPTSSKLKHFKIDEEIRQFESPHNFSILPVISPSKFITPDFEARINVKEIEKFQILKDYLDLKEIDRFRDVNASVETAGFLPKIRPEIQIHQNILQKHISMKKQYSSTVPSSPSSKLQTKMFASPQMVNEDQLNIRMIDQFESGKFIVKDIGLEYILNISEQTGAHLKQIQKYLMPAFKTNESKGQTIGEGLTSPVRLGKFVNLKPQVDIVSHSPITMRYIGKEPTSFGDFVYKKQMSYDINMDENSIEESVVKMDQDKTIDSYFSNLTKETFIENPAKKLSAFRAREQQKPSILPSHIASKRVAASIERGKQDQNNPFYHQFRKDWDLEINYVIAQFPIAFFDGKVQVKNGKLQRKYLPPGNIELAQQFSKRQSGMSSDKDEVSTTSKILGLIDRHHIEAQKESNIKLPMELNRSVCKHRQKSQNYSLNLSQNETSTSLNRQVQNLRTIENQEIKKKKERMKQYGKWFLDPSKFNRKLAPNMDHINLGLKEELVKQRIQETKRRGIADYYIESARIKEDESRASQRLKTQSDLNGGYDSASQDGQKNKNGESNFDIENTIMKQLKDIQNSLQV